jgi:hypothetical protein
VKFSTQNKNLCVNHHAKAARQRAGESARARDAGNSFAEQKDAPGGRWFKNEGRLIWPSND